MHLFEEFAVAFAMVYVQAAVALLSFVLFPAVGTACQCLLVVAGSEEGWKTFDDTVLTSFVATTDGTAVGRAFAFWLGLWFVGPWRTKELYVLAKAKA